MDAWAVSAMGTGAGRTVVPSGWVLLEAGAPVGGRRAEAPEKEREDRSWEAGEMMNRPTGTEEEAESGTERAEGKGSGTEKEEKGGHQRIQQQREPCFLSLSRAPDPYQGAS